MQPAPTMPSVASRLRPAGGKGTDFIVFAIGDPRKAKTWSNMPFFFIRTLERKGYRVLVADIGPPRLLQLMFDVPWKWFNRLTGRRTRFTFLRSKFNRRFTDRKIGRVLKENPEGHCVFMTFSFGAGKDRPYTLFCDQTFEGHIAYFDEREPDRLEWPTVLQERRIMRNSSLIISLFPDLAATLQAVHGNKVKYYGNVINLENEHVDVQRALRQKKVAREIVFIGNKRYRQGLQILAEAVRLLNGENYRPITVNVVGMDAHDLPHAPANMKFHGYLDKKDPAQRKIYTEILERSSLFVNPNPKWAAFSASCEALYYCAPVVIAPYNEFTRTFGDVDQVGYGLSSGEPMEVADAIRTAFSDQKAWEAKAVAGHEATETMSWDRYVDKFLGDLAGMSREG